MRRVARLAAIPLLTHALLQAQAFKDLQVERVSSEFTYIDGIVWMKEGYLLVADVLAKRLLRFDPGEKSRAVREDDGGVEGLATDGQGRIYLCEGANRRVTRLDKTRLDKKGAVETLVAEFQGKKLNAPNDIVVRRDGSVFFTDPAFGAAQDHRELDFYGVFHISPKGEVTAIAKWKTRPNGIALTQDGKTLYVTDSDRHAVVAFDLDKNGAATNERTLVKGIAGVPGGIRVDVQGRVYVAARNMEIYSPQGAPVYTIQLSEPATNCAFGQDDMESLFITTRKALYRASVHVKGAVPY